MQSKTRALSLAQRFLFNYFSRKSLLASFEITHNCNARCKHCHLGGSFKEKRASARRFGLIARQLNPPVVQISGGEPLLRQDIEEIIRAIRIPNRAPFIILTTNGALLTKKKYLKLRQAGIDEFSISLDYPDERQDEFRQIPGLFNKIKTLIESFDSGEEKAITLSCVIQKDNFKDLPGMVEKAKQWGVKINFSAYTPLRTKNFDYMIPKNNLSEFKKALNWARDYKKEYGVVFTSDYVLRKIVEYFEHGRIPGCRGGERCLVINPDGTLSPCGLILKDYTTQNELIKEFTRTNDCAYCYTSSRANSEKPLRYHIKDNISRLWS